MAEPLDPNTNYKSGVLSRTFFTLVQLSLVCGLLVGLSYHSTYFRPLSGPLFSLGDIEAWKRKCKIS